MADVSVDEIIEVCPYITKKMIEHLENFLYSMKEFENKYMIASCVLNSKDLLSCGNNIQEKLKNYNETVTKNVSKNENYLETIAEETEKLKVLQNTVRKEIAKNEKDVEILRRKLSSIDKKKENLADKRDEVQICKLLTKTTFLYKGSNIAGYVAGNKIQSFELDPEAVSQTYISNSLYNAVKKSQTNSVI